MSQNIRKRKRWRKFNSKVKSGREIKWQRGRGNVRGREEDLFFLELEDEKFKYSILTITWN